jgi:hypothetical protein
MPYIYYFCEAASGSKSAWHICKRSKTGKKINVSEDTPTLCGLAVSKHLNVVVTDNALPLACPKCVGHYRAAVKA